MDNCKIFNVNLPLTEQSAKKAKIEHQEKLERQKTLELEKKERDFHYKKLSWRSYAFLKNRAWFNLIAAMEVRKERQVNYTVNGFKVTIEKI
jgi:hypothetical protein